MNLISYVIMWIGMGLLLGGLSAIGLVVLGVNPINPLSIPLVIVSGITLLLLSKIGFDSK